jgi:hypothetical protein
MKFLSRVNLTHGAARLPLGILCLAAIVLFSQAGRAQDAAMPMAIALTKYSESGQGDRPFITVTRVGNREVNVPLLFDTGTAGTTVDCKLILPKERCSDKGVVLSASDSEYGIRVTETKIEHKFEMVIEHGQLAYAKISIGTKGADISTAGEVPFTIRYKEVERSTGKTTKTGINGIFGASPIDATLQRAGEISVLREIEVGTGLHKGYFLTPMGKTWKNCAKRLDLCPTVQALHIGIDEEIRKQFRLSATKRPSSRWPFATVEACIGYGKKISCKQTLFDTGSPKSIIAEKLAGSSNTLPRKSTISVTGKDFGEVRLASDPRRQVIFVPNLEFHVVGLRYFEENSLLFDFDTNEIGFRLNN